MWQALMIAGCNGNAIETIEFSPSADNALLASVHVELTEPGAVDISCQADGLEQRFTDASGLDHDIALAGLNVERGFHASMPSVQHLDPLLSVIQQSALTPEKLESLASIFRDRRQLGDLIDRMRRARFAAANYVLEWNYRRVERRYVRELGRFSGLPSSPPEHGLVQVARADGSSGERLEDTVQTWVNASMAMHDMLAARGAAYLHVLQPNQYLGGTKPMGDSEARIAIREGYPWGKAGQRGYPQLAAQVPEACPGTTVLDVRIADRGVGPT